VDYVDHGKAAGRRNGAVILKKPGRKAIDKSQPVPYSGETDWRILYNKSVKMK
jgi:hypothetical protein